jgi:hypothetical protein
LNIANCQGGRKRKAAASSFYREGAKDVRDKALWISRDPLGALLFSYCSVVAADGELRGENVLGVQATE